MIISAYNGAQLNLQVKWLQYIQYLVLNDPPLYYLN